MIFFFIESVEKSLFLDHYGTSQSLNSTRTVDYLEYPGHDFN